MRQADAAIVASLVKVVPRNRVWADYRYRVLRVYRGGEEVARGETISVRSSRRAAACALPRRVEHRYGLFLVRHEGHWTAGACSVIAPHRLWLAAKRGRGGRGVARGSSCAS